MERRQHAEGQWRHSEEQQRHSEQVEALRRQVEQQASESEALRRQFDRTLAATIARALDVMRQRGPDRDHGPSR